MPDCSLAASPQGPSTTPKGENRTRKKREKYFFFFFGCISFVFYSCPVGPPIPRDPGCNSHEDIGKWYSELPAPVTLFPVEILVVAKICAQYRRSHSVHPSPIFGQTYGQLLPYKHKLSWLRNHESSPWTSCKSPHSPKSPQRSCADLLATGWPVQAPCLPRWCRCNRNPGHIKITRSWVLML